MDYNAGGIFLSKSAGSFVECRILENVTQSGGGGLHSEGSTASFERCVFQGNEAQTGGAVESQESQDVFVNCLLVGNIAGEGGAVMVKWNGSGPRLRNCTIAANAGGPAIYCYNTAIEIRNSIIWGNSGGGILTGSEATPVVSHSCVQGDALWEGPGNIAEDPLFESLPLESHPGDFRLRAGSPAIDAGEAGEAPLADLEGNERPCGSGPDMGAYERCDRPPEIKFRRGEVDGSPSLTISDAIAVLQFLFSGASEPGCLDAADADDSGALDLIDPIGVLEYLFLGAGAPPEPGPSDCGVDPTPDALACAIDEACP